MIAILTGDIIRSTAKKPKIWLIKLKEALQEHGNESTDWEIYRGDSFQLKVSAGEAVRAALQIKASIKEIKGLDVRIGIGIGEENHQGFRITESNGSAYVRSGTAFENLKKRNLSITTDNSTKDRQYNAMLDLAMLTANYWSVTVAEVIRETFENMHKTQKELSVILKRSESTISDTLKRGGYHEMKEMCLLFEEEFGKL